MNIPGEYYELLFILFMVAMMTGVMTFAMSIINVGFVPDFVSIWLKNFLIAFIVATPTAMAAIPVACKIVNWLTSGNPVVEIEKLLSK